MRWNVSLEASGLATVTVDADTADDAEAKALLTVPGFTVEGGGVTWETISVWRSDDER